jgi:hypothetical protein
MHGQADYGGGDVNFFLIGTDELEKLFCILRSLFPGSNFDLAQLCDRLGAAADIQRIYLQHPELDKGSKKLSGRGSFDRVNVKSWRGQRQTAKDVINVRGSYLEGRRLAIQALQRHVHYKGVVDSLLTDAGLRVLSKEGVTLMRPKGKLVGVTQQHYADGGDAEEREADEGDLDEDLVDNGDPGVPVNAATGHGGVATVGETDEHAEDQVMASTDSEDLEQAIEGLASGSRGGGAGGPGRGASADPEIDNSRVLVTTQEHEGGRPAKREWMGKARALKVIALKYGEEGKVKSSDRASRVMGDEKGGSGAYHAGSASLATDGNVVHWGDPVACCFLTRKAGHQQETTVGVGTIVALYNKKLGKGALDEIPEAAFEATETTVAVQLLLLEDEVAEGGKAPTSFTWTKEYAPQKALHFKGGRFVAMIDATDEAKASWRFDLADLLLYKEKFMIQAEGPGCRPPMIQGFWQPLASDLNMTIGTRRVRGPQTKGEQAKEANKHTGGQGQVTCQLCPRGGKQMARASMRAHVAGHIVKGDTRPGW